MRDPRSMTLDQLMDHHDRNVRTVAYELMREISMTQLEEAQKGIPVYREPMRLIKENFRPLVE